MKKMCTSHSLGVYKLLAYCHYFSDNVLYGKLNILVHLQLLDNLTELSMLTLNVYLVQ